MRQIYIFLIFVFNFNYFNSQLHLIQNVIFEEDYGVNHPQIELNSLNEPIVIWTDDITSNCYISKLTNSNFNIPIKLNTEDILVQSYNWSGPDISIENENVYVVFRSKGYETGNIYLTKSTNNGNTFSLPTRVDFLDEGYAQYPDIAVFNDTIYITYMQHDANSTNPRYVLTRSFDGGISFEQEIIAGAITGDEACECCPPELVVSDKYVGIIFRNNSSNIRDIKGVISYDRGNTFTQVLNLDSHNWNLSACPSTGPDSRLNNQNSLLYTVYKSSENNVGKIFLNKYELNQGIINETIDLSNEITNTNYPQLYVIEDTIAVVFEGIGNSRDVYLKYSYNGIDGFNTENKINVSNVVGLQSKPDIVFKDRTFHVVFADENNLVYSEYKEVLGLNEEQLISKKNDLFFSKSSYNDEIDLKGKKCYSITGFEVKNEPNLLPIGTYYLIDKAGIQKLIILP